MLLGFYLKELIRYVHAKKLHIDIYRKFICSCQNVETTKIYDGM